MHVIRILAAATTSLAVGLVGWPATAGALLTFTRQGRVVVARDDGTRARAIARGATPVPSPDGRRIAFFRPGTGRASELWVVDADGRRATRLDAKASPWSGVSWSRDGRRLAVQSGAGVHVISVASHGAVASVAAPDEDVDRVSLAPDGRSLAYSLGNDHGTHRTVVVDLRTRRSQAFEPAGYPLWGPPGLAFERGDGDKYDRSTFNSVALRTGPGVPVRTLLAANDPETDDPETGLLPVAWSRDGRTLLVDSFFARSQPLLISLPSGAVTRIPREFSDVAGLSADGQRILVTNGDTVATVTPDGTTRTLARHAHHPAWAG